MFTYLHYICFKFSDLCDRMGDTFKCIKCNFSCSQFAEMIDHMIVRHPDDEIVFRKLVLNAKSKATVWQTKTFPVTPSVIKDKGSFIYSIPETEKIKIEKLNPTDDCPNFNDNKAIPKDLTSTPEKKSYCLDVESPLRSPIIKKFKFSSTPNESFDMMKEHELSSDLSNMSICDTEEDCDTSFDSVYLTSLIPSVLENLAANNQRDTFLKFNKMLAEGTFPMSNIAYLLFLDIVEWYSTDSTTNMRYSDETKQFWRVGMKLFKGKFMRFMSGLKNAGQEESELGFSGNYNPMDSKVNFAVPSRRILDKMATPIQTTRPEILTEMISKLSSFDPEQVLTYKVCVDGKKINAGVRGQALGDINLWGFEDPPTLGDRTERLNQELTVVESLKKEIELLELKSEECFSDIEGTRRKRLLDMMHQCIHILSERIQDLRVGRVGQGIALEKLMGQVTGDWRMSKYGFAISGIRTKMFEIDSCLSITLRSIDKLCRACSALSGSEYNFSVTDTVQMGFQENFVCLKGIACPEKVGALDDNMVLSNINQRSDAWFAVRKTAVITGSTLYKALGFDGLKAQKAHYAMVFQGEEPSSPDNETQKRMEYGSKNEINAVATLVSKIMPVYYPQKEFVEEGCYNIPTAGIGRLLVSPDGSLREPNESGTNDLGKPYAAVEIKCPYPGKRFTTPIHYKLPVYYVPQVICEMVALNVTTLMYISYSKESTVLLRVEFDNELWMSLLSLALDIYPISNHAAPKRIHPSLKNIRKHMESFTKTNVTFICEVQSVKAISCCHNTDRELRERHLHHQRFSTEDECCVKTQEFQNIAYNCSLCIKTAWGLCRQKATEVLVFLAANLDRIKNTEAQHASPIAYAFKGYSMKTKVMRMMLDRVLQE